MQFGQRYWNFLVKAFKKWLEIEKRSTRTSKNVPLDTQIAFLTSLPKIFCQKVDNSSLIIGKSYKKCRFSTQISTIGQVTRRRHFWQPCRSFLAKSPNSFCSKYHNNEKLHSFSKILFLRIVPLDTQIWILTSLPKNFLPKSWQFLTQNRKVMKRRVPFPKKFPQLFLWTRRMQF